MKIDLCKLFGVEEGEEFKIGTYENLYRIYNNSLQCLDTFLERWKESVVAFNYVINSDIIKLPKRKEFTDDELAIMRSISKDFKWMARDNNNSLYLYTIEPALNENETAWVTNDFMYSLRIYEHLFQSIQWKDEEPVFIDDYVER